MRDGWGRTGALEQVITFLYREVHKEAMQHVGPGDRAATIAPTIPIGRACGEDFRWHVDRSQPPRAGQGPLRPIPSSCWKCLRQRRSALHSATSSDADIHAAPSRRPGVYVFQKNEKVLPKKVR